MYLRFMISLTAISIAGQNNANTKGYLMYLAWKLYSMPGMLDKYNETDVYSDCKKRLK